jgi:hypothetical protein
MVQQRQCDKRQIAAAAAYRHGGSNAATRRLRQIRPDAMSVRSAPTASIASCFHRRHRLRPDFAAGAAFVSFGSASLVCV